MECVCAALPSHQHQVQVNKRVVRIVRSILKSMQQRGVRGVPLNASMAVVMLMCVISTCFEDFAISHRLSKMASKYET